MENQPKTPWDGICTGENAKVPAEKPFIIQACQRAASAAARATYAQQPPGDPAAAAAAAAASVNSVRTAADAIVLASENATDAENAAKNAADAGTAADAAASAAIVAKEAAHNAKIQAQLAEDDPTDSVLAEAAARAEEDAVRASKEAFGGPEPVTIPAITS